MQSVNRWRNREGHLLPSLTSLWTSARARQSCPLDPHLQVALNLLYALDLLTLAPYSRPDAGPPPNYTPPPPPMSDEEEEEDLGRRDPSTSTPDNRADPSHPPPPAPYQSRPQPLSPTVVYTCLIQGNLIRMFPCVCSK